MLIGSCKSAWSIFTLSHRLHIYLSLYVNIDYMHIIQIMLVLNKYEYDIPQSKLHIVSSTIPKVLKWGEASADLRRNKGRRRHVKWVLCVQRCGVQAALPRKRRKPAEGGASFTPPKFNMEHENDPFPLVDFQVNHVKLQGCIFIFASLLKEHELGFGCRWNLITTCLPIVQHCHGNVHHLQIYLCVCVS